MSKPPEVHFLRNPRGREISSQTFSDKPLAGEFGRVRLSSLASELSWEQGMWSFSGSFSSSHISLFLCQSKRTRDLFLEQVVPAKSVHHPLKLLYVGEPSLFIPNQAKFYKRNSQFRQGAADLTLQRGIWTGWLCGLRSFVWILPLGLLQIGA